MGVTDRQKAMRYLMTSQVCFWGGLIICYFLLPDRDLRRDGISVYGNFRASIVPYSAGLLLSALFMALGANSMPAGEQRFAVHRRSLRAIAVLLVALLLTPSTFGRIVGSLHTAVGSTLFVCQVRLAIDLLVSGGRSRLTTALLAVQFIGSFVSLMSLLHVMHLMFGGQIVTELAFGLLLLVATARVLSDRIGPKTAPAPNRAEAAT